MKVATIGPSGVHALPVAAGPNEGGHYFWYFGPSGVRASAEQTKVATIFDIFLLIFSFLFTFFFFFSCFLVNIVAKTQ